MRLWTEWDSCPVALQGSGRKTASPEMLLTIMTVWWTGPNVASYSNKLAILVANLFRVEALVIALYSILLSSPVHPLHPTQKILCAQKQWSAPPNLKWVASVAGRHKPSLRHCCCQCQRATSFISILISSCRFPRKTRISRLSTWIWRRFY